MSSWNTPSCNIQVDGNEGRLSPACECRCNSSCCLSLLKVTFFVFFFSRDTEIRLCLQAGFALLSPITSYSTGLLLKEDPDVPMSPPSPFASLFNKQPTKAGVSLSFCAGGQWGFSFLVFLMKESKKRRRKQAGKLMAKSRSQLVNLPGARPLMNPLLKVWRSPWQSG